MLKYISESIHEISALNKKNQRRVSCLNYCHGTDSVLDRFSVNEQVTKTSAAQQYFQVLVSKVVVTFYLRLRNELQPIPAKN